MIPDPAAVAAAERIRAQAGARVHRLGHPDEIKEDTMPRKAATEPKPAAAEKPAPKKRGRKPGDPNAAPTPRKAKAGSPRFDVFDDGSVTLNLPTCKGQIAPVEAREFLGFLAKIGVKA